MIEFLGDMIMTLIEIVVLLAVIIGGFYLIYKLAEFVINAI